MKKKSFTLSRLLCCCPDLWSCRTCRSVRHNLACSVSIPTNKGSAWVRPMSHIHVSVKLCTVQCGICLVWLTKLQMEDESAKLLDVKDKPAGHLRLNILSYWTYWWIVQTIRKGYSRPLSNKDVYEILPEFATENLGQRLELKRNERRKGKHDISGARAFLRVIQAFSREFTYMLLMFLLMSCARLSQPSFFRMFLDYISSDTESDYMGYTYAGLMIMCALSDIILSMHAFYLGDVFGIYLKGAYSSVLYDKILKMNSFQHQKVTTGLIINLFSTDLECITYGIKLIPAGISTVFSIPAVLVLLYLELGWCSLVGLAIQCAFLILGVICSRKYARMRSVIAQSTDCRVQLMNEIISGIRVIKMYCLENAFRGRIKKARKDEMNHIARGNVFYALSMGLSRASTIVFPAAVLITYRATGHDLTVSKVFPTMLYCQIIDCLSEYLLKCVLSAGQIFRSLERIEDFLRRADGQPDSDRNEKSEATSQPVVQLTNVTASWDSSANSIVQLCQLKDITLTCEQGSLTAVVGPVGAGKTSLLMHLAGELPLRSGTSRRNGEISYCPQDAWIFQDTVQQNILFGHNMDADRYAEVLDVCGLVEDISKMPSGDLTVIGDRGLTLSGGQKARISLARAVYRDADIYLLDDPLSAVDSRVGRHIFERAIKHFLAGKIRILVTHQTQYLPDVDQIVVIRKGCVTFVGSFDKISELPYTRSAENEEVHPTDQVQLFSTEQVMSEDSNVEGDVGWSVYFGLIRAGGTVFFIMSLLLNAFAKGVTTSASWYLSEWTNKEDNMVNQTFARNTERQRSMDIYVGFATSAALLSPLALIPLMLFLAAASNRLHDPMFFRVIRAPMRFFYSSPVGIVINKFSRDLGFVDLLIPLALHEYLQLLFTILGRLVVVCLVMPWLVIATVILSASLYAVYRFCLSAYRDLKRLEASARSPLFSHVSETLNGLQTIRIFKEEEVFTRKLNRLQDTNTMCWFMFMTCFRWLAMVLACGGIIFLILAVSLSLLLKSEVPSALVGLCLTFVLATMDPLEVTFRFMAEVEIYMTAVERILQYTQLEQEPAPITDCRPPSSWPEAGHVKFQNVSLYYHEGSTPALKDVSFEVRPREKIGIVGRTGSGKSSLLQSLLRLTEPRGRIYLDDVNIIEIGIQDLRKKISVIPQDPVLFNGTVRQNLDPTCTSTDDELWQALRKVQLFEKISELRGGLEAEIHQGGSNLSVGQRQLMCLARALLKGNKILVLDEATANIDRATDQVIQVAIRAYFRHCTILIIAHRLETIMDCSRVMVLDNGCLMEYDNPYVLLQNSRSLLYEYAQQLGEEGFRSSLEIAKESYTNRL